MRKGFLLLLGCLLVVNCFSQNNFSCIFLDAATHEPLPDVSVLLRSSGKGSSSDANGKVMIRNIPNGKQVFVISSIGYKEQTLELNFPLSRSDSAISVSMEPEEKEIEQVIISSSRTDTRIENTVTRVEVLGTEEVEEESGVRPSNIASLLGDVAGIQSQQTSAVSGNTDLRIQGLPGNYTQILRDGMPLFGGYAGSFSILQIPPLDLKQDRDHQRCQLYFVWRRAPLRYDQYHFQKTKAGSKRKKPDAEPNKSPGDQPEYLFI
jgi:outer membrane receptor for ferrienterochelin and colicins